MMDFMQTNLGVIALSGLIHRPSPTQAFAFASAWAIDWRAVGAGKPK
jgi:hypothetical protein